MKKIKYLAIALALLLSFNLLTAVPALAAPVVAAVTGTAFGTDTTDHYVNMPATVTAGDLLIVPFTNDGSATVTTPAGWSLLASNANGSAVRLSVYYKIAAGTEGGTTVNFVTSPAEEAAALVYRITNWQGTTPPAISTGATGTSTAPNPPSLDPAGWDFADTLWLAVAGQDRGDQPGTTAYPAHYSGTNTLSSSGTGSCRTLSAHRALPTASENPGAFTIPVSEDWVAFTIAVRPSPHDLTISISSTGGGSVIEPGEGVFTYDEGAVVDLVATPDAGGRFVKWTDDLGAIDDIYAAETTITMNGDYSITANFVAMYDLNISSAEGGLVTEPGEDILTYDEGTVVDLVATPDAGYRFDQWTGDVGTIADVYAATTIITMNGDYSITANFIKQYDLTTSSTEGGSVTEPGEDIFAYDEGTVVDLVVEAEEGYRFVEWTGDVGTIGDVYAAETTITMNGDYSITANFIKQYDLTISSTEGGSVTEPGEDIFTYDEGTVVDLVAEAEEGYRFVEWTGDVGTIADVHDATTTITMNGDYSITANFVRQYNLTTSSTAGGTATTPGQGTFTYDAGTVVSLVATPTSGYQFVNWTGNVGTIANVNAATTTITMNGDYSITANFIIRQYNLTTSSTAGGTVTTPGVGTRTYDAGTVVSLVATPTSGYRFVNWTGSVGTIANVNAASTTITMNSNYSITANFVAIYDLFISSTEGVSAIEPGEGVFTYDEGTVVDLVAKAEEDYWFVEWTGDVGTIADVYAAETTITMNGDYSITANFEEVPLSQVYPTVTTQAVTNITTSSTTLNMSYTVGNFSPVEVCFAYKKSTDSAWSYTAWVSKTTDGTHAEVLTGLDFNTTYDFKSRLKYDGTVVGGTTLQFTTDTPSPSGSGPCFIATAAYGTPTAKQIDLLREFRDVVLLKSTMGSQFVALYYQLSPPIADFIAGNELLTTLVRELLVDPIVWVVQATGDTRRN